MSGLADIVKNLANRIATALGHDASQAEHRLLHDTGDRLEANVKSHVEHDAGAAATLERAATHDEHINMPHGASEEPSLPHEGSGPSTSTIPEPHGAGREPLPGETDLPNPGEQLSSEQYPYLQSKTGDLEAEAIPGPIPPHGGVVSSHPDTHPELPATELSKFDGLIDPDYMQPGHTYYRGAGDGTYPNSSYWTPVPPNGEPGFRRDLAVLNEWNGDHGVVTFTPDRPIPVWSGKVGPQWATGATNRAYLPGGGTQIWLPQGSIGQNDGHWTIAPMPGEVNE